MALNPMFIVPGETREQGYARRAAHLAKRQAREQLNTSGSAFHPWNRPGISHEEKMRLRTAHLARRTARAGGGGSDLFGAAGPDFVSSLFGGGGGTSSYIGGTAAEGSAAPRFIDNIALIGAGVLVVYLIIKRRK